MKKNLILITVFIISFLLVFGFMKRNEIKGFFERSDSGKVTEVTEIDVWNGSRTTSRQLHEREVMEAVLDATTDEYGEWVIVETPDDYDGDMEARAFRDYGHDMFVTVAGNLNLKDEKKILVTEPIMKGILGFRALIIREDDINKFGEIDNEDDLKSLRVGIPHNWPDAEFFRFNGYEVVEGGSFEELFERLNNEMFDYTALGANEVEGELSERGEDVEGLKIEEELMVYYPFPLIFYVNPDLPELAERIEKGMIIISENGTFDEIFFKHNREMMESLNFWDRKVFRLENPIIPDEMKDFQSSLLD